jgi:hypothetical protein
VSASAAVRTLCLFGCTTAQNSAPRIATDSEMRIPADSKRDDLVVLDSVEGSSSTTSVLVGLLQIIDGSKVELFFVSFFVDKHVSPGTTGLLGLFRTVGPEERAYYEALEQDPDADRIFSKSLDCERWGVPPLFENRTATWRGKAAQIQSDTVIEAQRGFERRPALDEQTLPAVGPAPPVLPADRTIPSAREQAALRRDSLRRRPRGGSTISLGDIRLAGHDGGRFPVRAARPRARTSPFGWTASRSGPGCHARPAPARAQYRSSR